MSTPADQPDMVTWLRAQLDDDERRAPSVHALDCELTMTAGFHGPCTCGVPDRIEAEVDAKRRILDDCESYIRDDLEAVTDGMAGRTVAALALPYADQPGYRPEWRP